MNDLLGGFNDLTGIGEAREVQHRPSTALEKLLDIEKEIIKLYSYIPKYMRASIQTDLIDKYHCMYPMLEKRLIDIDFNESDIVSFVYAKLNNEYTARERESLGLYTGVLLEILTRRNNKNNKRTKIHINGNGGRFDYLFACCRVADEIIVENFAGGFICSMIGSAGKANRIITSGIKGFNTLYSAASNGGYASQIIGLDIYGIDALRLLANKNGKIGQVVAVGLKGYRSIWDVANELGEVQQMICVACEIFVKSHIKGEIAELWPMARDGGKIHQYIGIEMQPVNLSETYIKQIISEDYTYNKFGSIEPPENVDMLRSLAKSLKGKSYEEVVRIAEQLYLLRPRREQDLAGLTTENVRL